MLDSSLLPIDGFYGERINLLYLRLIRKGNKGKEMKVLGGKTENGIVVGNTYDKYASKNPIVQRLMHCFELNIDELVQKADPKSINEVGCGEGYWTLRWIEKGLLARGCDFSTLAIDSARKEADLRGLPTEAFNIKSIYELTEGMDSADLIVCCEVLEHLEYPRQALKALQNVTNNHLILSVPREPLWRLLNLARGKYFKHFGNTPGHIQQWTKTCFLSIVSEFFDILDVRSPIPWTIILCSKKKI